MGLSMSNSTNVVHKNYAHLFLFCLILYFSKPHLVLSAKCGAELSFKPLYILLSGLILSGERKWKKSSEGFSVAKQVPKMSKLVQFYSLSGSRQAAVMRTMRRFLNGRAPSLSNVTTPQWRHEVTRLAKEVTAPCPVSFSESVWEELSQSTGHRLVWTIPLIVSGYSCMSTG